MKRTARFLALTLACIASCAAAEAPRPGAEGRASIGYSVSSCYGTCPTYEVVIGLDDSVRFTGEKNTAVQGRRQRRVDGVYRRTVRALSLYRPKAGTRAQVSPCAQMVSDQQSYRIVWTDRRGVETVLTHDRGCLSHRGAALIPMCIDPDPWSGSMRPADDRRRAVARAGVDESGSSTPGINRIMDAMPATSKIGAWIKPSTDLPADTRGRGVTARP